MAIELEGLEFQIDAKSESASKSINALVKSLGKLKNATKGLTGLGDASGKLGKLNEALANFHTEKIEKLSNSLQALNGASNVKISSSIPKRISDIAVASKQLSDGDLARLERLGNTLQSVKAAGNIPAFNPLTSNPITPPSDKTTTPLTSGVSKAVSQVQEVGREMDRAANPGSRLESILAAIGGTFSKGFNVGVGVLRQLGGALGGAASHAMKFTKNMAKLPFALDLKTVGKMKGFLSAIKGFLSSIKRVAMYRAIRMILSQLAKGFREGISNLYQYSLMMGGTFAGSMDKLATSSQYLSNSLGAMAAPIINALAPAIDFLINKIVTLLNYINMLFARLSGAGSFMAAKKSAKAFGKAVGGAGGSAKKAAKEIRDATLGIDELNVIMQKDPANGGGGGGGADYGSMFEERPIANNISDFVDRLKEAFKNADWKTLGTLLGEKVNESIEGVNWKETGRKVGVAINGAVQTAYHFLDTVNFKNIGAHIAERFNGTLKEIDFSFVGRLFVKPFTSIADLAIGVISKVEWGLIAKSVSDRLVGIYDELAKWLNSHDWSELGKTLWQNIKKIISNIDYAGIAKSFFTFLGRAFRTAVHLIGGFFEGIIEDIKTWWNNEIRSTDWREVAGNILKAIGKGFANLASWVWENIIDPLGRELLGETWDDLKEVAPKILKKVADGWKKASHLAKNVGEFVVKVKNDATAWWGNVKTWWGDKVGKVKEFTTNVTNQASVWWSNVKAWWSGEAGGVKHFTTNVANQSSKWWNNTKTWWSGRVGEVELFTTNVANQSSGWWDNVKFWWSEKVGTAKSFSVGVVNSADGWWKNVKKWWSDAAGTLWTNMGIKLPKVTVNWHKDPVFGWVDLPSFNVKWNAEGGILDGAQIFGRLGNAFLGGGEAGKEAVLPLERHTEWMDTLANKVRDGLPNEGDRGNGLGMKRVLEVLQSLGTSIDRMAVDVKRQADKSEKTTVQIGNKTITDAVVMQQNADGYRFVR